MQKNEIIFIAHTDWAVWMHRKIEIRILILFFHKKRIVLI